MTGSGTIFFSDGQVRPICANAADAANNMTTARQAAVLIFLAYMYGSLFAPESEVYTHWGAMLEGMSDRKLFRSWMALFALCAALPALADTQFRIRRMTRNDVPPGKGQCDIRLQVDNEVEVSVRRDMVMIHTLAGRDPRDDGSECNAPLPDRNHRGIQLPGHGQPQ